MYVVAYCSLYEGTLEQEIVYASSEEEAVLKSRGLPSGGYHHILLKEISTLEQMQKYCWDKWEIYINVIEV